MSSSSSSSKTGIMPAPAGETVDFDGISQLQITILTVYIATSFLATLGLVLRLYTGAHLVRNLGLDAILLVASWAVYLASFIGMVKVMPCGFGKHLWSVTESGLECYKNMLLFLGVTYFWPPTLAKLSLIVLFHRINPNRTFRLLLYGIAFTCTVYTLVFTVVLSYPCNPLHAGTTTCLNNIALAQAILNITTDGVLIIMPMVTLWGLQMARKQKIAVWCILALGSAAIIASCVRIAYVRAMLDNPDVTYTQGSAAVWSAVEINIGILCNCLAMLKPFVRRHLPWLKSLLGVRSGAATGPSNGKNNMDSGGPLGGGGGGGAASLGHNNRRNGYSNQYHRDRRVLGGQHEGYQLHSFGKDLKFGTGSSDDKPDLDEDISWTEGIDRRSGSDTGADSSHAATAHHHQKGILVTTTVAMGRSSEGDISTDNILGTESRAEHYTAISAPSRAAAV